MLRAEGRSVVAFESDKLPFARQQKSSIFRVIVRVRIGPNGHTDRTMNATPVPKVGLPNSIRRPILGVTLIELLCVLAILAVIASLYLPAIARAYSKVKHMFGSE